MSMGSVQTIAVTGGKGGVGKSNVAVNLAIALGQQGRKVVLLDADLGLANIDILLGVSTKKTIENLLNGECSINELLVEGPQGISIVPASSGLQRMVKLSPLEHAAVVNAFSDLGQDIDYLIIDTAAGISDTVINFAKAAQEVMFVVTNEPTSITDAYALIKLLNMQYRVERFHIVTNMVKDMQEGRELFKKLTKVTDRFLDVALEFSGAVPFDESVRKSVRRQRAFLDTYPKSKASIAIQALAKKVDRWPLPAVPRGHLEFFVDRLIVNAASA